MPIPHSNVSPHSAQSSDNSRLNWGQIKFTSKLIPTFAGKEEENVAKWIEWIASIACLYNIGGETSSWENLKFELRYYFERRETYTAIVDRIKSRTWKAFSEKFLDYAEDKLKLMQAPSLTEREKIDFLADRVRDPLLRGLIMNTHITEVPDFIDHVRKLTEDSLLNKRGGASSKPNARRPTPANERTCSTCKRSGHLAKDCRVGKPVCYRCGQVRSHQFVLSREKIGHRYIFESSSRGRGLPASVRRGRTGK